MQDFFCGAILKPLELVNLWDMIKISLGRISAIGSLLAEFESKTLAAINLSALVSAEPLGATRLADTKHDKLNVETLTILLTAAKDQTTEIGLDGTRRFIEVIINDLDKITLSNLQDNLKKTQRIMEGELREQYVLQISNDAAWWYDNGQSFGLEVLNAFPSSEEDIIEAGNCYAFDRSTACVFHAMRVLEYGLGALAKDVGLTFDIQNWHTIIEQIESEIKAQGKAKKSTVKDERLQFLSEAAKEFTYFKDGWRNHVTHKKRSYDTSQAYSVLTHVRLFMMHLSTQLTE